MAGTQTSSNIDLVLQNLKNVIRSNLQVLDTDFSRLEGLLIDIQNQFQSRQKRSPEPVERCLEKIKDSLQEAQNLIDDRRRERERERHPSCCNLFSRPDLSSKPAIILEARFDVLMQELQIVLSTSTNTEQILPSRLLQPAPGESDFVGSGIESAREQLHTWLTESRREARVIGVYGDGGVGKTSLLKIIYNAYTKEVSRFFDLVIWFTVSRNFENEQLQGSIAEALNLSLEGISDVETRKSNLNASLERKKFLLILDNVQSEINLTEVGVKIGDDKYGSKLLISSRSEEVIKAMGAKDCSLMIEPLSSEEEGWELFRRGAFAEGVVPRNIESIAREMSSRCKGLPLAINAVAAAMKLKETSEDQWTGALNLMCQTDASTGRAIEAESSRNRRSIDTELYRLFRWSYNELSDPHLQNCFLNCAAFLEDKEILVETLVEMWDAEGLLNRIEMPPFMDARRYCINALVSRRLVECVEYIVDNDYHSVEYLKIHEVFHDMAIGIGQRDDKCFFAAGRQLQNFETGTREIDLKGCKRISVAHNAIRTLPEDLKCSKLQSLVLASNLRLEEVPKGFFSNVTALQVLDLSCTSISTLPTSMGQLRQLKFLNLSRCSKLVDLPDTIGELKQLKHLDLSSTSIKTLSSSTSIQQLKELEFLNLSSCSSLVDLPSNIADSLKNLKHLKLDACYNLKEIPSNLCQLRKLNTLILPLMESTCAMSVEDLTSLSDLIELTTVVKAVVKAKTKAEAKAKTKVDWTMDAWSEMRNLTLECDNAYSDDADADDVDTGVEVSNAGSDDAVADGVDTGVEVSNAGSDDAVADDVDAVADFEVSQHFILQNMGNMEKLESFRLINYQELTLTDSICKCRNMKILLLRSCYQLQALPALEGDNFPMLEKLVLKNLLKLESIAGSPGSMWNAETMSNLQLLVIINCPLLEELPEGMTLPHLRELHITMCNKLTKLEIGSFPMLEMLTLDELHKLETISSGIWNASTMSRLQILKFIDCPLLRLPTGIEELSHLKQINGEVDWWHRIKDDRIRTSLSERFLMM